MQARPGEQGGPNARWPARWRLGRSTLAAGLSAAALVVTSCVDRGTLSGLPPTVPSAPTGAYAVGGLTGATVSWTAPASSVTITGYEVVPYLGTTAKPGVRFSSLATTETVSLLTNFATYWFAVEALGAGGASPPSKQSNFVVINLQGELAKSVHKFIATDHVVGLAAAVVMPTPGKSSTPSAMDFLDGLSQRWRERRDRDDSVRDRVHHEDLHVCAPVLHDHAGQDKPRRRPASLRPEQGPRSLRRTASRSPSLTSSPTRRACPTTRRTWSVTALRPARPGRTTPKH